VVANTPPPRHLTYIFNPVPNRVNGGAKTSSTELIRKSSQAELGAGFFEGDGLIDRLAS